MQKSGISISKESESPSKPVAALERQQTPAPSTAASGGNFVSGVEEDLNLIQESNEDDEQLVKMMEEKFEAAGLEKREDFDEEEKPAEPEKVEPEQPIASTDQDKTEADDQAEEVKDESVEQPVEDPIEEPVEEPVE